MGFLRWFLPPFDVVFPGDVFPVCPPRCVVLDDPVRTDEVLGFIIAQLNARSYFLSAYRVFSPVFSERDG